MLGSAVLLLARFALVAWMAIVALLAFGSLITYPAPFVLMAFSLAALPVWRSFDLRRSAVTAAIIAAVVTSIPLAMLVDYGAEEGGISGSADIFTAAGALYGAAALASAAGLCLGRAVWAPMR